MNLYCKINGNDACTATDNCSTIMQAFDMHQVNHILNSTWQDSGGRVRMFSRGKVTS